MRKIMYYSTPWCVPCQTLGPIMDQVSAVIPVVKINIDYEANAAQQANVRSIPTVILVENEQEVRRFVGARSYQDVMNFING
jgi:thioredoxin-like negative regulator of GroEL